jgi:hypothetical protein
MYFITKFMYLHKHPSGLPPVWSWVVPGINTILSLTGFFLCWNYFPVTGLEYWKKKWDKNKPYVVPCTEEEFNGAMATRALDEELDALTGREVFGKGIKAKLIADPDSRV